MNAVAERSASDRTPTILIIDDMPANLGVMVEHLAARGWRVLVAQEGEEGLTRARFALPDLILLDVMMPGAGGFETCRRLKADERTRDIPVIFMTALADVEDKLKGFAAGAVDYVAKPFHIDEVLARVGTHLALRSSQQQLAVQNAYLAEQIAVRREAEAALQAARDELEQRVAARTAALGRANASLEAEIAERTAAQEALYALACHDALTGLPNRGVLEERLAQAIAQALRHGRSVAVLFIDLDGFKHINDTLGHQAGDQILRDTASRLQQCVRAEDCVARLGGDEFVISLAELAARDDAALVAHKIMRALEQPFLIDRREVHVSGSIGISAFPADGETVDALLRGADMAMYAAKDEGPGNFRFFTAALSEMAQRRRTIADWLRRALSHDELELHYQPQVDLANGRIFAAEALIRWRQPGNGLVASGEFVPMAEETGLILPMGEWVLRHACEQLHRWREEPGAPDLCIAVNLSVRQFHQPGFQDLAARILAETGLPASALDLEITESLLVHNPESLRTLNQLSDMGVQLAVDDFGTGYSSLAYLQRFPIDELKIDRSFVSGIGANPHDTAIVTAIIAMAHSLQLKVVAEGVETAGQLAFLAAHGCEAAQGFYFGKPVSADAFTELLRRQHEGHRLPCH